jgi:toxin ParE1/3/4
LSRGGSTYRLSAAARRDVAAILAQTVERFGTRQHKTYVALLNAALGLVAQEPARPGSKDRSDLAQEMRSFPVALAANRRGASAHVLFYVPDRPEGILVLRVLHRSMDPQSQLCGTLD